MNTQAKKHYLLKKRKNRVRAVMQGTNDRPRMCVSKSHTSLEVQLIDDVKGVTMVSHKTQGKNVEAAKLIGKEIAQKAKKQGIQAVIFDRSGYRYHGVIQMIADTAREGGLVF